MDVFSHLYASATPARNTTFSSAHPFAMDASSRFLAEQILDESGSSINEDDHGDLPSPTGSSYSAPRTPFIPQPINVASLIGATAGGESAAPSAEPLLDPLEDLRGYVCMSFVPPMPEESRGEWVKRLTVLKEKRPAGVRGRIRAVVNPVVVKPNEGRRTLVGIERIDAGELRKGCDNWTNARVPRRVHLESVHHVRPDLFLGFEEQEYDLIPEELVLDPEQVSLNMRAKNFNSHRSTTPSSSINDGVSEDSNSSSTEVDSVKSLRLRARGRSDTPLSSSSSTATSTDSSGTAEGSRRRSISRTAPPSDEDDRAASGLSSALRRTLFHTASSVLHLSEGRATRGWRWMSRREAWDHAAARKVDVHGLTVDEAESAQLVTEELPFAGLDWMVWGKPGNIDPVNGRDKGALGMLVVFLPP
ncbi:hypothetical protein FRB90_008946, partial [Tulasnella sp. 427]